MKHFSTITSIPAKAFAEDHPGAIPSLIGFLQDPIGQLTIHIQYLLDLAMSAFIGDKEID
jgi:hypothetical protein